MVFQPAQAQESSELRPWDEGPLSWKEFRGKPEAHDHLHGAVTYAGIALEIENIDFWGNITFRAFAVFDRSQSWTREKKDLKLLAHEQLHFDIAEIYARRLEKRLNDLKLKRKDADTARRLKDKYNLQQLEIQALYDKETVHGISESVQARWHDLVTEGLQKLDPSYQLTAN
ncbi:hypothetical protein AB9P05_14755 [Roseivirga sp. BDSF3-8]|uniref:DUF922 domain-containing protein n=1 Tax=Roseivirga sp. BDSF3-8 TaxID=3241598 RepID=UPI003531FE1E